MDIRQLQYFSASVRCGSFTKAAEALYTTQPHVSYVIKSLEQELGTKLLQRSTDGIRLTDTGEQILVYAENVLKTTEMIREISRSAGERYLRIAANPSSSLAFTTGDFFMKYMEQGIDLHYTECSTEKMPALIIEQQYDLGILFVPTDKETAFSHMAKRRHLIWRPLRASDLVVHAGPHSLLFNRTEAAPEELDGCTCIQFEDDYFAVEDLLMSAPAFQRGKCRLRRVVTTNSDHMMIRMLQTTALCNIGSYWTESAYGKYAFSMTRIKGFENSITFGVLIPDNENLRPEAEEFLQIIMNKME